jgi:uncharacterized coiled-coil protein SlyX
LADGYDLQQTDIVHSSTAEESSRIDSRFAVQQEAIDEVEAMVTNTGNTVEQHEHLLNRLEDKLGEATTQLELKHKCVEGDLRALEETVDGLPIYNEKNRKRSYLALSRVSHSRQYFVHIDTDTSSSQIEELADK